MFTLNYTNGCGGNWLSTVITRSDIPAGKIINFRGLPENSVRLIHSLDMADHDYVFSGSYVFNFWLNVIYKLFCFGPEHGGTGQCLSADYGKKILSLYGMGCYLHRYVQMHYDPYFNFDDLVSNDGIFHNKVVEVQHKYQLDEISYHEFSQRKQFFFSTCVDPLTIYQNKDNFLWTIFLLSYLHSIDIIPHDDTHFLVGKKENQKLCREFVESNLHHTVEIKCHQFQTGIFLPGIFGT